MEMRHGWLELSTWRRYIHQLEELLVSSGDPGFNRMIVHDKELTDRWTSLSHLLEHTEVVSLLLLLLLLLLLKIFTLALADMTQQWADIVSNGGNSQD